MKRTVIVFALVGISSAAFADLTYNGLGPYYETASIAGHTTGTFYSGLLNFTDSSNSTPLGTNFNTICVDLDDEINGGASWSFSTFDSNTLGGGLQTAGNIISAFYSSVTTNAQASGLQLAAWEAVYDNGAAADFANGNFIVTNASSDALTWATYYYDNGASVAGDSIYFRPADGSGGQGQMAPVPEPASFAALGLGLLALRRRRKTTAR
ncbi:MAG TPA: PEP-CTERM sorting domain-containing protein [Fimbriimonadaceae bacterium]|nr:PEP-CTERM sorting domain-containing protein [Fimbriimonadaceae bacterium]